MPNILTRPVLRHMYNISVILHICIYEYIPVYIYKIKSFWKWDYCKALQSLELKWKYWNTENNYSLCSVLRVSDATVPRWALEEAQIIYLSWIFVKCWGISQYPAGQLEMWVDWWWAVLRMCIWKQSCCSSQGNGGVLILGSSNVDSWKHLLD